MDFKEELERILLEIGLEERTARCLCRIKVPEPGFVTGERTRANSGGTLMKIIEATTVDEYPAPDTCPGHH
jgi:hypothetical protein